MKIRVYPERSLRSGEKSRSGVWPLTGSASGYAFGGNRAENQALNEICGQ